MNQPVNALAAFMNPSLDDQLSRLVAKHGADAVREATKRATAKKRGRKPEKDWLGLKPWVEQDADDWLHGRDPMAIRSNYAVAKAFAEENPGHNRYATKERIERKLRERRRWFMLVIAMERAEAGFPLETYIRALRDLERCAAGQGWAMMLEQALGKVARYREQFGEPSPEKSFDTIDSELRDASNTILGSTPPPTRGLFGARRVRKPVAYSNPQNT